MKRAHVLLRGSIVAAAAPLAAVTPATAATSKEHRLAMQVSRNDAADMNLALNNAANASSYYNGIGEAIQIDIVAYGPGLYMLRDDASPVKERLKSFQDGMKNVRFSACSVTLAAMEKAEGKKIALAPGAEAVPAGVVHLVGLQESGWSYIKP